MQFSDHQPEMPGTLLAKSSSPSINISCNGAQAFLGCEKKPSPITSQLWLVLEPTYIWLDGGKGIVLATWFSTILEDGFSHMIYTSDGQLILYSSHQRPGVDLGAVQNVDKALTTSWSPFWSCMSSPLPETHPPLFFWSPGDFSGKHNILALEKTLLCNETCEGNK